LQNHLQDELLSQLCLSAPHLSNSSPYSYIWHLFYFPWGFKFILLNLQFLPMVKLYVNGAFYSPFQESKFQLTSLNLQPFFYHIFHSTH
jgi:hypothetical protein